MDGVRQRIYELAKLIARYEPSAAEQIHELIGIVLSERHLTAMHLQALCDVLESHAALFSLAELGDCE
ncbi:MAG: hypothetical protein AB7L09_01790 [Nitrospira sp.]